MEEHGTVWQEWDIGSSPFERRKGSRMTSGPGWYLGKFLMTLTGASGWQGDSLRLAYLETVLEKTKHGMRRIPCLPETSPTAGLSPFLSFVNSEPPALIPSIDHGLGEEQGQVARHTRSLFSWNVCFYASKCLKWCRSFLSLPTFFPSLFQLFI